MYRRRSLPPLVLLPLSLLALSPGCRHAGTDRSAAPSPVASAVAAPAADRTAGVARMRARLEAFNKNADPTQDKFLSRKRAALLQEQLARTTDPRQTVMLLQQLIIEEMNDGETEAAIKTADRMAAMLRQYDPHDQSGLRPVPDTLKAVAYMRLGETQNCCANRSPEACLLPIRGGGIHTKQEGSRQAIRLVTGQLSEHPDDLSLRWLLNIAYMTLGEYPVKVPAKWLIPPSVFKSEYDLKPFRNVAPALGLDVQQLAGGTIIEDFDNDGYLDVMVSSFGAEDEMRYFHNNGDGTFTDRTKAAGLLGELGGQNLIQTDYDNDGNADVLILRGGWRGRGGHQPKSLLHNNGDGTFSDVTDEAGLHDATLPSMTAVWFDYDGDGWLDLFLGNESAEGETNPCQLFHNNHDGTFTECAAACGLDVTGFVKAAVSSDYDHDGRPDLFLSCWKEPNRLYHNDGADGKGGWKFTEIGEKAGVTAPLGSFSCFFFDYDNDGWDDLFVVDYDIQSVRDVAADYLGLSNQGEKARLYHNNHDGTFADVTKEAHLDRVMYGMGINFGDLDNDGWLDFYVGTGAPNLSVLIPNRMFRNADGKYFQEVTTSGNFGHLQKGHGISFADIDNDGDQDIYESMGGAYEGDMARSVLYENPGFGNHFLTLKLQGVRTNRAAIGARVKVVVATPGGRREICRTVGTGGSFGANPLRVEIGLGRATAVERVEVFWPVTGRTQVVTGLEMDRGYAIREGDAAPAPLILRRLSLSGRKAP